MLINVSLEKMPILIIKYLLQIKSKAIDLQTVSIISQSKLTLEKKRNIYFWNIL